MQAKSEPLWSKVMDNILSGIFIGVAIGVIAVVLYAKWKVIRLQYLVDRAIQDAASDLRATQDVRPQVQCRVEEDNGIFYVFNRDTNEFLGQGSAADEIASVLNQRFPKGIVVNLVESTGNAIDKLKATQAG